MTGDRHPAPVIGLAYQADEFPRPIRSMVNQTVGKLADLSLAAEEGDYLGSEQDLIDRFEVSRPTLRQAAKVVENDRLLSVRRGVNGGFYAARPDARHAIQSPARWLRLQATTLDHMNKVSGLIIPEISYEAAKCTDAALIAELAAFRDTIDVVGSRSHRSVILRETELARLLGRMSGNPVLILFTDIAYAFGLEERDSRFLYERSRDRRAVWIEVQKQMCEAVLAGDADRARSIAQRRTEQVDRWLAEDHGSHDGA